MRSPRGPPSTRIRSNVSVSIHDVPRRPRSDASAPPRRRRRHGTSSEFSSSSPTATLLRRPRTVVSRLATFRVPPRTRFPRLASTILYARLTEHVPTHRISIRRRSTRDDGRRGRRARATPRRSRPRRLRARFNRENHRSSQHRITAPARLPTLAAIPPMLAMPLTRSSAHRTREVTSSSSRTSPRGPRVKPHHR